MGPSFLSIGKMFLPLLLIMKPRRGHDWAMVVEQLVSTRILQWLFVHAVRKEGLTHRQTLNFWPIKKGRSCAYLDRRVGGPAHEEGG